MVDENVPALAPIRSNEQILPFAAWVPIGKSNCFLDLQKKQKNPIFQIYVDILQNINFFRAFTTSASVLAIYIQQFWNTLAYEAKTGAYSFYTNVDFAELIWEEFVQAIQTFLTDKANLGSPIKKGRKYKPHVIPYCWFTKLIICHVGRIHNIHQRSTYLFHLAEEDFRLGNLKFIPKGEVDKKVAAKKEGKKKTASAKQPKPKPAKEKPSKPFTAKPPKPKPAKEKSTKATPLQKAGKGKVAKVHNVKSSFQLVDEPDEEPAQPEPEPEPEHQGKGEEYDMEHVIQMSRESFQAQSQAHVGSVAIREPVAEATRPLPVVEGKGKAINPATEEASTGPSTQPQDDTSANIVRDSLSPTNAETGAESGKTNSGGNTEILQIAKEPGEDVDMQVNLEEKTVELEQDQAGPDPEISRVALARPDPEPTHDEFMANLYPKNLEDAYTIGDQFINDKSTENELGKLNVEAEVVSMVTVLIYQASSSVHPLSTPVINLSPPKPASSTTQAPIFTATTTTTTTLPPPP
ncbi:hypothetical protein Tco_1307251 [Tanacetum coccineum]